jgi:hypothetical protein
MDRAQQAHNQLITLYGKKPGRVCEKCANLVRSGNGERPRCALSSIHITDAWRSIWQACGQFLQETDMPKMSDLATAMFDLAHRTPDPTREQAKEMRQTLARGLRLQLTLHANAQRYHLVIWRDDVMPSPAEETVIRRAFRIPLDAKRETPPGKTMVVLSWPSPVTSSTLQTEAPGLAIADA